MDVPDEPGGDRSGAASLPGRLPWPIPAAIAAAWVLTVLGEVGGRAEHLHHGAPIEGGTPLGAAYPGAGRGALIGAFLIGYSVVWSGFGVAAFLGEVGRRRLAGATPWLQERLWLVAGALLALAARSSSRA